MITDAQIEADQHRQEAIFEQLPPEQQAAILEHGRAIAAIAAIVNEMAANARINAAPDVAADDDDPFAPVAKPNRAQRAPGPAKTYTFTSPTYGWQPELTIAPRVGSDVQRHQPSESTYARFVALANSGDYVVEIATDEGIGWTLRRKAE